MYEASKEKSPPLGGRQAMLRKGGFLFVESR